MAVTATPIYPQTLTNTPITIVNATGSSAVTAYTGGANGTKLEAIYVTNTDSSAAYAINVFIKQSSTSYLLGTVNVPLSSGNTTSASTINLLSSSGNLGAVLPKDSNGNPYIYLSSASSVTVASTTTVTSAKTLTFLAQGEDF
jgi:ribosomal protein S11